MTFDPEFYRKNKRLEFLLRGVSERGLLLQEWKIDDNYLAVVSRPPEKIDAAEKNADQIVDLAAPGVGASRLEAVHTALTAYITGEEEAGALNKRPASFERLPFSEEFAQDVVIGGLTRCLEARRVQ